MIILITRSNVSRPAHLKCSLIGLTEKFNNTHIHNIYKYVTKSLDTGVYLFQQRGSRQASETVWTDNHRQSNNLSTHQAKRRSIILDIHSPALQLHGPPLITNN